MWTAAQRTLPRPDPWISHLSFPTKFTTAIAVDTWDAHFRWRDGGDLRDRTIDATWRRVASAVAAVEGAAAGQWEQRYVEAFQGWRIVPDARLLKWAGTGTFGSTLDHPRATLNLGTFIVQAQASEPCFDYDAFSAMAALAVRFLDDACLAYSDRRAASGLCVGIMGFADVLASLGYAYTSESACEFATLLGQALAAACRESSLQMLRERGPSRLQTGTGEPEAAPGSGQDHRSMLRHPRTTAIHSQRLVALFANNASDALDPLSAAAFDLASRWGLPMQADPVDTKQMLLQQIRLRGRLQPWIDAPIDYPLVHRDDRLDPEIVLACRRLAELEHLPEPRFRRSRQTILG